MDVVKYRNQIFPDGWIIILILVVFDIVFETFSNVLKIKNQNYDNNESLTLISYSCCSEKLLMVSRSDTENTMERLVIGEPSHKVEVDKRSYLKPFEACISEKQIY
jgi:hypothetical protein